MNLLVTMPVTFGRERQYVLDVILKEFLGLTWVQYCEERVDVSITRADGSPGELCLPDSFFRQAGRYWLDERSLPAQPLAPFRIPLEWGGARVIDSSTVPIIYGDETESLSRTPDRTYLPIDIFGSAFFMLVRYEEVVKADRRDHHDRFPASASVAYEEGFVDRPIVDEYVEILWAAMSEMWPDLSRRQFEFAMDVSHDVDRPSRYQFETTKQCLKSLAADCLRNWRLSSLARAPAVRRAGERYLHEADPANTFDFIMDLSEKSGIASSFYFICGRTHPTKDAAYDVRSEAIGGLIRTIHDRGHRIGLHPSYNTYLWPERIREEAETLRSVFEKMGVEQKEFGARMHILRWRMPTTLWGCQFAGVSYDNTITYAEFPGFRCGTCREYSAFDCESREPMRIRVRPLVVMECSVMANRYLGLGAGAEAYDQFKLLKDRVRRVNGRFTLLWHNTELVEPAKRELYASVLGA